jgi:hypothetical protein
MIHLDAVLTGLATSALGSVAGYFTRKYKEPKVVVVPPASGQSAPYEVRVDGRSAYLGFDLQRAKLVFKDPNMKGVLEFYNNGNHVASRRV